MDAHAFSNFLKEMILTKSNEYKDSLLNVNYESLTEGARKSGVYHALKGIADSIDPALEDFFSKNK